MNKKQQTINSIINCHYHDVSCDVLDSAEQTNELMQYAGLSG